ncbi:hypothetical protein LTR56_017508 [Elasticomyces elasticus]|nr:hypothetical protein LTR56_017508 [Elasticomyces elasticus]KAK3665092.1 hypothetical protein LTR22_004148 [Elasticomyces elasticus]KAK4931533.1 hypothetical protein LTR49_001921 [Elasticomyces elasticus]KAK5766692.1 hypothetical protein LTS12_003041 [Elasticomyces elasticus]
MSNITHSDAASMTQPSAKRKAIDGNDFEDRMRNAARTIVKTEPSDEDDSIHDSGYAYELRGPSVNQEQDTPSHRKYNGRVPPLHVTQAPTQLTVCLHVLDVYPSDHRLHLSAFEEIVQQASNSSQDAQACITALQERRLGPEKLEPLIAAITEVIACQKAAALASTITTAAALHKLLAAFIEGLPCALRSDPLQSHECQERDMKLAVYTFSVINASFTITEEELKTACTVAMGSKHVPKSQRPERLNSQLWAVPFRSDESAVLALTTGITLRGVTFLPDPIQHEPPNIFLWRADEALAIEPTAVKRRIHEVFGHNTIIDVTYRRVEKEAGGILVLFAKFHRSPQLYSFFLRLLPEAQDTSRAVQAWFRPVRYCLPCEVCQAKHMPGTVCEKTDAVPMT